MAIYKATILLSLFLYVSLLIVVEQSKADIGVCYGLNGNNLAAPRRVVNMYRKLGFEKMRIFEPYPQVLEALRGSGIQLILGTLNSDIPVLASSQGAAQLWFRTHVQPYINNVDITHITVGNEVVPGQFSESILPAMINLQNVLKRHNLGIKATTVVHSAVLGNSYPPSTGRFSESARPFMRGILNFLSTHQTPLLVNLYPYFAYASDPKNIPLDYALSRTTHAFYYDGSLGYSNLLDSMIDAFYSSMEKEGVYDVNIVISETGWPHDGNGDFTTTKLAGTYNRNFIRRAKEGTGTPKRPNTPVAGYVFAMFDENLKAPGVEQYWGLFNPATAKPNYLINFS